MKTVLRIALGVVTTIVVLFVVAVAVGVRGNMEENKKVANATSQVVIEAPRR